jgi:ATP/maltotriose-dependent transcriptional regulator MalT
MKNNYQNDLVTHCIEVKQKFNEIIDKYVSQDIFCSMNRDKLMRDIDSNMIIKNSPAVVCIIEYSTKSYLYVSENIQRELDITAKELLEQGLSRALVCFEENHRNLYLEKILPTMFETYAHYAPTNEAQDLHVTYNTMLTTAKGEQKWFFHQLAVLACDENRMPRYALKFLSNIHDHKTDETLNFNIYKKGPTGYTDIVYSKDFLPYEFDRTLSTREKEIMKMVTEGYSTKTIAEKLFISPNTVSTHRKNLLKKLKKQFI